MKTRESLPMSKNLLLTDPPAEISKDTMKYQPSEINEDCLVFAFVNVIKEPRCGEFMYSINCKTCRSTFVDLPSKNT